MEARIKALEETVFGHRSVLHNRIKGRFGNQLFQYWLGHWIAMNTNMRLTLYFTQGFYLDPHYFPNLSPDFYTRLDKYIPIPRPKARNNPHQVGEILTLNTPHPTPTRVYNCAFPGDYVNPYIDPDTVISEIRSSPIPKPVLLSTYNEYYPPIKKHQHWIRTLYARTTANLGPTNTIVIHVRLGDLKDTFLKYKDDYISFVISTLTLTQSQSPPPSQEVILLSEDSKDPLSLEILNTLQQHLPTLNVTLKPTSEDTVQEDFDTLYRAQTIIMTNSTFSWWAAFLNPFNPRVYVGVSKTRSHDYENRKTLFERGPKKWHIFNLDTSTWIRNNPIPTLSKKRARENISI